MRRLPHAIIILFILFLLTGCSGQSAVDTNSVSEDVYSASYGKKVSVYYIKGGFLAPVTYTIGDSEPEISSALNLLFSGIVPQGFQNPLTNARLNTLEISGDTVSMDVSCDAFTGDKAELAKYQIIYTLTDCQNVTKININVDGKPYVTSLERPTYINIKDPESYRNDKEDPEELEKYLTIYYPDRTMKYLIPVTIKSDKIVVEESNGRIVSPRPEEKARAALEHLFEGAGEIGSLGAFDDKMIKSLQIKDGVAVVDLDSSVIIKFSDKTQYAEIAVESVVRTLTAIDEIERVQFLVGGVKLGYITGNINIQNPIEPDKWYNILNN